QVRIGPVGVPGATVTASQADKRVLTSTDQEGVYKFADLADGVWTLKVEMIGFAPVSQDVTVAPDSPPSMWELKLRPFDDIARDIPANRVEAAPSSSTAGATTGAPAAPTSRTSRPQNGGSPAAAGGFQR